MPLVQGSATERHTGARLAKGLAIASVAPLFLLPLTEALELPALRPAALLLIAAAPLSAFLAWRARGDFANAPTRYRNVSDADLGYRVGFALTALWSMVLVGVVFLWLRRPSDETARGEAERDRGQLALCNEARATAGKTSLVPAAGQSPGQKAAELSAHVNRLVEARAECERAGREDDARVLDDEERRLRAQITRLSAAVDERE